MKLRKTEIVTIGQAIANLPSSVDISAKIAIARNKHMYIKPIMEEFADISKLPDAVMKHREGRINIGRIFAEKNEKGDIRMTGGRFTIPIDKTSAYESEIDKYDSENPEVVAEEKNIEKKLQEWLSDTVNVDFVMIKGAAVNKLAKELTPETLSILMPMIEINDEADKKED